MAPLLTRDGRGRYVSNRSARRTSIQTYGRVKRARGRRWVKCSSTSGVRPGLPATRRTEHRPCARPTCTSRSSARHSGRCSCRWCRRRTFGHGDYGFANTGLAGVFVSDEPLSLNEGATRDQALEVTLHADTRLNDLEIHEALAAFHSGACRHGFSTEGLSDCSLTTRPDMPSTRQAPAGGSSCGLTAD